MGGTGEEMKNFIISCLVALAAFGIGFYFGMSIWAGIPTGLLGFGISYFLLARSSMSKLQTLIQSSTSELQQIQNNPDPQVQLNTLDATIEKLNAGFSIAKEQFLIGTLLHSQVGMLHYQGAVVIAQMRLRAEMSRNTAQVGKCNKKLKLRFDTARGHLEQASAYDLQTTLTRNWMSAGMLACLDFRDKKHSEAVERLKKVQGPGGSDPMYWALLAWIQHSMGEAAEAMLTISSGLDKNANHAPLKSMAAAIQNKKTVDMSLFGQQWFLFFPEHLTAEVAMRLQSQMGEGPDLSNMNRKQRRAVERQSKKSNRSS